MTAAPFDTVERPKRLTPPFDVSRWKKEADVKSRVKDLLNYFGWFTWMPSANGFGQSGQHDHLAIKDGVFLTVESKFGTNKPSAMQKGFAAQIIANDGYSFCVNERNIDHFAYWLESFAIAVDHQLRNLEVPPEHGARLLNAISVLTDAFAE